MMRCCKVEETRGRRSVVVAEHDLIAATALVTPIELGPQWSFRSAEVLGQELVSLTLAAELWIYSGTMRSA
eukprot:5529285-Lingulodinium_polyedra.AAC.1